MPPQPFNITPTPVSPTNPTPPSQPAGGNRASLPGPRFGKPMPPDPTLSAPTGKTPHHRSSLFAKGKTNKGKHVIPKAKYGTGRAKPTAEY
jgi:hypothetical protein